MPDVKDMDLRDWFAAQALTGLLAGKAAQQGGSKSTLPDTDEPGQQAGQTTSQASDVETERVLRFLHG